MLSHHTATDDEDTVPPGPGDMSICVECGALLLFDEQLKLIPCTPEREAELKSDPSSWQKIEEARYHIHGRNYGRKCEAMLTDYQQWLATHPDLPVLISFKIPDKVFVAGALVDALKEGFIVVDDNGKRMLQELGWLDDTPDMPSLAMVRAVINHAHGSTSHTDEKI